MIQYKSWNILWNYWLVYIKDWIYKPNKWRKWIFRCKCWNDFTTTISNVKNWHTKSCWCLEWSYKHWWWANKEENYLLWIHIKSRIFNKNIDSYCRYWWRWISMYDERVNNYELFNEWIKSNIWNRPSENHSLDRIDNNGNYEPWNIRWATMKEQNRNCSSNIMISYNWDNLCAIDIRIKYVKNLTWLSWQWFYDRLSSWRPHKMAIEHPKTKWRFDYKKYL